MKLLFFVQFLFLSFLLSSQSRDAVFSYTINGRTTSNFEGTIISIYNLEDGSRDSLTSDTVKNRHFTLTGEISSSYKSTKSALVYISFSTSDNNNFFHLAVLDSNTINVNISSDNAIKFTGSDRQDMFQNNYEVVLKALDSTMFYTEKLNSNKESEQIEKKIEQIESKLLSDLKEIYFEKGKSKYLLYLFYGFVPKLIENEDFHFLETLCNDAKGVLNAKYTKAICHAASNRIKVNSKAPMFSLTSLDEKMLSLEDVNKDKYVLLDFWASWCVPCRKQIPRLKNLYVDLSNLQIEFISISIDEESKSWKKAIKEENLNLWPQLLDNKMQTAEKYSVYSIPKYILLDPEGNILTFTENLNEIEESLKENNLIKQN